MKYEDIIKDLKKQEYKPIYFLMGEEPYFIDKITDLIVDNAIPEKERTFNQTILYGKDINANDVFGISRGIPMMGKRQLLVIKEAQDLKDIDKLSIYTEKPNPATILVFAYKHKNLDKRTALYKALDKSQHTVLFASEKIRDYKLNDWIKKYIKDEYGRDISDQSVALLAESLGTDLSKLCNEISKLIIALPNKSQAITPEVIEANIGISKDYNSFELTNALGSKDIRKANLIINYFAKNPNACPMPVLIATLFNYFLKLLRFHYLGDKSPSTIGINNYFLRDYQNAARHYNANKIVRIMGMLREYDIVSKGYNGASTNSGELMRELMYKILH